MCYVGIGPFREVSLLPMHVVLLFKVWASPKEEAPD